MHLQIKWYLKKDWKPANKIEMRQNKRHITKLLEEMDKEVSDNAADRKYMQLFFLICNFAVLESLSV